jgi:hypothetical protein
MIDDDDCGAIGGMRIIRETEVRGENVPQCHFDNHKFHMTSPGLEPGPPRWDAGDELWHGHLHLLNTSGLFPADFSTKIPHTFLLAPTRAVCRTLEVQSNLIFERLAFLVHTRGNSEFKSLPRGRLCCFRDFCQSLQDSGEIIPFYCFPICYSRIVI